MLAWMGGKRKKFEMWKKVKSNGRRGSSDKNFAASGFSEQYASLASLGSGTPQRSSGSKSKPSRSLSLGTRGCTPYELLVDDKCESSDFGERQRLQVEEVGEVSTAVQPAAQLFPPHSIETIDERLEDSGALHAFPQKNVDDPSRGSSVNNSARPQSKSKDRPLDGQARPKLILKKRARSALLNRGRSLDLCMISMEHME